MAVYGIVAAAVIGLAAFFSFQSATAGSDIRSNLTLIAPAGAGGGWDTFMREQQQAMRANSLVNNTQVVNIPGAAGTIGLGQLSTMEGQANTLMVTGAGLVAGVAQLDSAVTHDDVRPIARVVEEYDVVVVPADSPYETIDELVQAWRANPAEVAWTGGGTFDQLVMTELALAAGIEPSETTYIPKSGGGEATQALITGTADAATSGYMDVADQIEAGRLKALGMAAPERLEGVEIPTLTEQGYEVDLANWRAVLAPPGITDEEFAELRTLLEESVATPEWQKAIERNKWTEVYLAGEEFDEFLASEQERIAMLVEEIS
ncbi:MULTISPECIES: tripartite tricarboxylate transporter substrate binding protein [Kocuria]|uniref:Tripartite tricarboxylate transporter substrate binding protein n=1 Tax=Kocuria oceani TaxID=988827 RepID=A0ABV9TKH5_9MICC|nr:MULTISPECIES: tripartite tricarboxylate transporter substrate-binding protein [Kocuria]KLU10771.1 tricarboxylic transport membrane protein [Kocuria sp. SM24M-10]OLT09136.1 tricarboxylic transporter [Kocuria sp. CNJ-770]